MTAPSTPPGERIAKRIAASGLCSRRDAEALILEGKVKVDGVKIDSPALNVAPHQAITVSGKPLAEKQQTRLWLYHKPEGLVTTRKDEKGRATVFDALPKALPRVVSIGRLDLNSEGLLLLTTDGALSRRLELPSTGWTRRYRARVFGHVTPEMIASLARGITVEGQRYGGIQVVVDSTKGDNSWVTVSLKEGKNREIRHAFEHFGCQVSRLIRIAYGPFQLGNLEKGHLREVSGKVLREMLGN